MSCLIPPRNLSEAGGQCWGVRYLIPPCLLYTPPVERRAHQHMAAQTSSPSHALHSSPLDTPASTRARRLDDGQRPPPHHAQRLRPTLTPHAQQQLAPRRPTETLQCMASARPRSHPARADTAPTLTHATRDRPTRARARRRSSGVCARPAPHSPAPKEHGTPMPCTSLRISIGMPNFEMPNLDSVNFCTTVKP